MYEKTTLLFLTCETPLHAGIGAGLGAVDLPIQRERSTEYPMVQGSGLKGALRSVMPRGDDTNKIFGPEMTSAGGTDAAGMIVVGDGRILAFPVRSLRAVFVWVTCLDVLARLKRELGQLTAPPTLTLPTNPPRRHEAYVVGQAAAPNYSPLVASNKLYLEEYEIMVSNGFDATHTASELAGMVFPAAHYSHWVGRFRESLVILHDDTFRDFVRFSTEVNTRVALVPDTKTVRNGALWTEECLPADSILYSPIRATAARLPAGKPHTLDNRKVLAPDSALEWVQNKAGARLQVGGDETISHGIVGLKWL